MQLYTEQTSKNQENINHNNTKVKQNRTEQESKPHPKQSERQKKTERPPQPFKPSRCSASPLRRTASMARPGVFQWSFHVDFLCWV